MQNNTFTEGNTPVEAPLAEAPTVAEKQSWNVGRKRLQAMKQPTAQIPRVALLSKKRAAKIGLQDLRAEMENQQVQDRNQPLFDDGSLAREAWERKNQLESGDLASIDQEVRSGFAFMTRMMDDIVAIVADVQPANDDEIDEAIGAARDRLTARIKLARQLNSIVFKRWDCWIQQCPPDFDREKMGTKIGAVDRASFEVSDLIGWAVAEYSQEKNKIQLLRSSKRRDKFIASLARQLTKLLGIVSRMPIDQDSFRQSREGEEFTTGQIARALGFKDTTSILVYIRRLEKLGKLPARPEKPQRSTKAKNQESPGGHRKYSWPEVEVIVACILNSSTKAKDLRLESVLARF